jgi:AcrR family transcriptional regulator
MLKDGDIDTEHEEPVRRGRKRDLTRDGAILDAALEVLAEVGYEGMTMDMVATRAKAGKATVYRRWASKPELVLDAVARMKRAQVDLDQLPDTGSLRGDLVALARQEPEEDAERRLKVMGGLASLEAHELGLGEASGAAVIEPWIEANRTLISRAIERGEFSPEADVETLARVVPSMGGYRALVERRSFNGDFFVELIDSVLLPALRGVSIPVAETEAGPAG